jgi:short-subunit dehydrogenase
MRRQGRGHIINIASIAGKRGLPYSGAYSATKFAMIALSEAVRVELAGSGVDVSIVCPIWTDTEFFDAMKNPYHRKLKPVGPTQSAAQVAQRIVACAHHPKPEVMTFRPARLLAVANAIAPGAIDRGMRRVAKARGAAQAKSADTGE